MPKRHLLVTAILLGTLSLAACSGSSGHSAVKPPPLTSPPTNCAADACIRLNQVQVVGTHNSYHFRDQANIFNAIKSFDKSLAESIEYNHPVLPTQFSR